VGLAACARDVRAPIAIHPAAAATGLHAGPSAPAWTSAQLTHLRSRLADALRSTAAANSGIAILDANARPLYTLRERAPFAPASTFKVLAAIGSLESYGPNFRFETDLRSLDDPADGIVKSDLYLVGSGDPTLTSDDLRSGVGAVYRSGARSVEGALVADASAFAGPEVNKDWDPDDLQYGFAAGTSALSVDQGTVEFHLVPSSAGVPARIDVRPRGAVRVAGSVLTSYATSLSIDRAPAHNDFTFSGRVAVGAEQSFWRPVVNLPMYAGRVVQSMLAAHGIDVHDGVRTGVAPLGGHRLWVHRSQPLRQIVRDMLFTSNNHFAEQLLRSLGAQRGVGTEATGALVVRSLFERDGVPTGGLRIVDGSGLAASDRIAPLSMATFLARAAEEPVGKTLIAALPRVGLEGTVRYRRVGAALGRAVAKSGHIENVNALAGYVHTKSHGLVTFAFIINDRRADDGPVDEGITRALDVLAEE